MTSERRLGSDCIRCMFIEKTSVGRDEYSAEWTGAIDVISSHGECGNVGMSDVTYEGSTTSARMVEVRLRAYFEAD